jgi:signal peptidase II
VSRTPRSRNAIVLCFVAVALLTAADLGSKHWALERLSRAPIGQPHAACEPGVDGRIAQQRWATRPIVLIDGYLEFRYAENCGAAFGFMRDGPALFRKGVFYAAALGAIVLLFWMFASGRGGSLFAWSVPLIVAGALGNLVDRIRLGYVVDFVRFHLHDRWAYPTFNVADAWITVGVILILLDGFRETRRERIEAQASRSHA